MTKLSENLPIEEARERLRQLISELAVVRGHVVLASGKEADYYVDLRHHPAPRGFSPGGSGHAGPAG